MPLRWNIQINDRINCIYYSREQQIAEVVRVDVIIWQIPIPLAARLFLCRTIYDLRFGLQQQHENIKKKK